MFSLWTFLTCFLLAECMVSARNPFSGFKMSDETSADAALGESKRIEKRHKVKNVICPCGWESFGAGCYKFVKTAVTWDVARSNCQKFGGDLVVVSDAIENGLLAHHAEYKGLIIPWIGYFRPRYQPNNWLSVCGVTPGYTNWNGGEPNNSGGTENCAHIYTTGGDRSKWNDVTCDRKYSYICEFKYVRCN